MTREEIIKLAREANIKQAIETPHLLMVHELERFATLVAAAEREALQRKPLKDEQMWNLWNSQGSDKMNRQEAIAFARAIEAAHGIKDQA